MALTLRSASTSVATTKGSALTHAEMDANWLHALDSSNQSFLQSGTGAVATTIQDKVRRHVDVLDFIPVSLHASIRDASNTTDLASYIQAAIDYCITNGRNLFMPAGDYKISSPLFVYKWSGTAFSFCSITIEGEKRPWNNNAAGSVVSTRIVPSHSTTFAIGVQNGRGVRFKDIALYGTNVLSFTSPNYAEMMTNSNFVTGSCRDSRYSPYSGIVIDPFGTSAPADSGYPGLSSFYVASAAGSSGVEFESVVIRYFVVGVCVSPNGTTQNAEDINFTGCDIAYNKAGVAICQSQSRDINWYGGECAFNLYCFDGQNYGSQQGSAPKIYGCNMSGKYLFNTYSRGGNPFYATGIHAESFASIGFIDNSSATARSPALFAGSKFQFLDFGGIFPDHHLFSCAPVTFDGCEFSNTGMTKSTPLRFRRNRVGDILKFRNCWFGTAVQGEFFLAPAADNDAYAFTNVLFDDCNFGDSSSRGPTTGVATFSQMSTPYQASDINKATIPYGAIIKFLSESSTVLKYNGTVQNSVSLGTVTVTTGANGTATFTVADGTIVRTGDLIYTSTSTNYENYQGSTTSAPSSCIGIVTAVDTNDITISGVPQSLATGSFALTKKWWSRFHAASTGDTNSNTSLTNVTPTAAWANGDAIKGTGIPAGAYIVSGGGTGTLTISKAATATAAGVRLYDADINSVSGSAV